MVDNTKIDKDVLVRLLAEKAGFNLGDSRDLLDSLIEILEDVVEEKREFSVRGFGKMVYGLIEAHKGTDPRSGDEVWYEDSYRIHLKLSKNILGK